MYRILRLRKATSSSTFLIAFFKMKKKHGIFRTCTHTLRAAAVSSKQCSCIFKQPFLLYLLAKIIEQEQQQQQRN